MRREDWERLLRDEERRLSLSAGFKFLYGPWTTLSRPRTAFLSLKPGRAPANSEPRMVSEERGNSYEVERASTVSPITEQFLALAELLSLRPSEILTGVVTPFRADSWDDLSSAQKAQALELGRLFWKSSLTNPSLRTIIAVSSEAAALAIELTGAVLEVEKPAHWGKLKICKYRTPSGGIVLHLPHLSRFKLMSRKESRAAVAQMLEVGNEGSQKPAIQEKARKPVGVSVAHMQDLSAIESAIDEIPHSYGAVFRAALEHPDYDCAALRMQLTLSFRGRKVGGLNRRISEWYVSKIFVAENDGPSPLERRGFRRIDKNENHRYWALKGERSAAAFAEAVSEMTGVPLLEGGTEPIGL